MEKKSNNSWNNYSRATKNQFTAEQRKERWNKMTPAEKEEYDDGPPKEKPFNIRCCLSSFTNYVQDCKLDSSKELADNPFKFLLKLKGYELDITLIKNLANEFNEEEYSLTVDNKEHKLILKDFDRILKIGEKDFTKTKGRGATTDPSSGPSTGFDETRFLVKTGRKDTMCMSALKDMLQRKDNVDDFKRAFALVCLRFIICPPSNGKLGKKFLKYVEHVDDLKNQPWAGLAMRYLVKGIKTFKNPKGNGKRNLGGSMVFLQLYYFNQLTNKEPGELIMAENNMSGDAVCDINEDMDTMAYFWDKICEINEDIDANVHFHGLKRKFLKVDVQEKEVVHEKEIFRTQNPHPFSQIRNRFSFSLSKSMDMLQILNKMLNQQKSEFDSEYADMTNRKLDFDCPKKEFSIIDFWSHEDILHSRTKKRMDTCFDEMLKKLNSTHPLVNTMDELIKSEQRIGELQQRKREFLLASSSTIPLDRNSAIFDDTSTIPNIMKVDPFTIRTSIAPSDDQCKFLEDFFKDGEDSNKFVAGVEDCSAFHLTKKVVCELMPKRELSNFLINHVTDVLNIRQITNGSIQRWYFPTLHQFYRIYSKKNQAKYQITINQLRSVKQIFFPLVKDGHWNLIVFNNEDRKVEIWDTTEWSSVESFITDIKFMCEFLDGAIKPDVPFKNYIPTLVNVPKQFNIYDCGVYVCRSMEFPDQVMKFHKEKWISSEQRCLLAGRILRAPENIYKTGNKTISKRYSRSVKRKH